MRRHGDGVPLASPRALAALAEVHGGEVDDDALGLVVGFVSPASSGASAGSLVPVLRPDAVDDAVRSDAALLVDASLAARVPPGRRWVHRYATWVMAALIAERDETPDERERALIEPGAHVAASARIGAFAVVRRGVTIGAGSVVEPHAVIHGRVSIGARVRIGAGAVIGRPGFGWATGPGDQVRRIAQRGGVVIEDDVDVGAHCTVDAGTLGPTVIGRGAKLDAHVHVGHNVVVHEHVMIAAQTGLAGSVTVGRGAMIGGQVGVADHVVVGESARLAAKSGVIGDVPAGATFAGYPAVSRVRWLRGMAKLFGSR